VNLHEAIQNLVETGESDPLTIAQKIAKRNDKHWLAKELVALAEDLIAEMARHELGRVRRSREVALRPGDQLASSEMKIAKSWVPGEGYKPVAELTETDLLAKAAWYERASYALARRALWCREVVTLMQSEGVAKVGALKAALPVLPEAEELTA
jgi:hypothetical protein